LVHRRDAESAERNFNQNLGVLCASVVKTLLFNRAVPPFSPECFTRLAVR
jgi:hypothetical protein